MHVTQREKLIVSQLEDRGFVTFQDLSARIAVSAATLRRDLSRLAEEGKLVRVRGGIKAAVNESPDTALPMLSGSPFDENVVLNRTAKRAIGAKAAEYCEPGETIIIDGGSTTLQMCPFLAGKGLHVVTNSLHVVSALLPQPSTRITVPGGSIFREQNIILSINGEQWLSGIHAPKIFLGAAFVGRQGIMQADAVLAVAERGMIEQAEWVALLVDSSKFKAPSGTVVCALDQIDVVITDAGIPDDAAQSIRDAGAELIIV